MARLGASSRPDSQDSSSEARGKARRGCSRVVQTANAAHRVTAQISHPITRRALRGEAAGGLDSLLGVTDRRTTEASERRSQAVRLGLALARSKSSAIVGMNP